MEIRLQQWRVCTKTTQRAYNLIVPGFQSEYIKRISLCLRLTHSQFSIQPTPVPIMDRRGGTCSFDDIPPEALPMSASRDRPPPRNGILRPGRPADQDIQRMNLELLKSVVKEQGRLVKHALTAYPKHRVRRSTSYVSSNQRSSNVDIPDEPAEAPKSIWDEIYLLEQRRDETMTRPIIFKMRRNETLDEETLWADFDLLLERQRETMANISKETFCRDANCRAAPILIFDGDIDSPALAVCQTGADRDPRQRRKPGLRALSSHVRDPTSETSSVSESTVLIPGRMNDQDPDFQPPLSRRVRRDYRTDGPEYPFYFPPERSTRITLDYDMCTLNHRIYLGGGGYDDANPGLSFGSGGLSRAERCQARRDVERVSSLADLRRSECVGRETALTTSQLKYLPRTMPTPAEAWRVVVSRVSIPGWVKVLHDRSLET